VADGQNKGFWLAVIALVTAIASLITATLPLISPVTLSWMERRRDANLLSKLPSEIRETCTTDSSEDFADAVRSIECFPKGARILRVAQYNSARTLYKHYNRELEKSRIPRDSGNEKYDCTTKGPSENFWPEPEYGAAIGREFCSFDKRVARIDWTNNGELLYAYLIGNDKEFKRIGSIWTDLPF
jgi:hypothetical protein